MTLGSRPRWVAAATFALGIAVAGVTTAWHMHANRTEAAQRFADLPPRLARRVAARMQLYEYGLRGARSAVVALGSQLDRQRFRDYYATRDLEREFPGTLGFGLIRRVAATDEASFVAAARSDGWPDFAIRELEPHAGEHYVVQYIEPVAPNRTSIGLDVASESGRRTAAETAMRSGDTTLTAPITLVQATGKPARAFLLMLPIYQPGAGITSPAQREAATIGWAHAPQIIDEVLRDIDGVDGEQYLLSLRDTAAANTNARFYGSPDRGPANALREQFSIPIFGRTWHAELRATPRFMRQLNQRNPAVFALVGAALAALLAALASLLAQRSGRAGRLRVEQERRAAIVDGSIDAIIGESLDGIVTDWNAGAERLFGYPADLAVGRAAAGLVLPHDRESEDTEIRAAIARGEWVAPFDTTRRLRDGTLADVSVTASPMHDARGRCFGMSKTVRDISEARRAQRAFADLNASLENQVADRTARLDTTLRDLRNIVDALPSMIGYWDKDLTNRVANQAYAQWFGLAPGAMHGRQMRDVLGEQAFARTRPHVEAVLRGERQIFERSATGSHGPGVRHLLVHYLPDAVDGDVRGFYVLVHDLTELTESRFKLLATSSLLEAVLAAASEVSIIASDVAGVITLFNRGAERLLGYDQAEMVGRRAHVPLYLEAEVQARSAELTAAYGEPIAGYRVFTYRPEHHGPETREWTCVRKDGGCVPVSLTVTAMRDDRGQLLGYLGVAHDVSLQKQHERSLRDAVHKAKHANRAKSQFLANMSHEIRTPMNAVIGLAYLLERTTLDAEQAGFLAKLTLASKSLLVIINDVLDLSKIEAAELTIERAPFHLGTLLGGLSALMTVQADARRVDFAIDAPGDLPVALEGDATRLHQILTNLTSNAIKFTERGSVGLSVRQMPAPGDRVRLRFAVKDSGIGIAPEALARLFMPFAQADASTTRRFGGTGLGLSIVKQLVGLMGGELGVSSTPGVGSEFWVELPFAVCAAEHVLPTAVAARPARRGLAGVRVLVADDSAINLEVARRILELEGAEVRLAGNGQEAVDELLAHPDACDVVLMDIHMPVLDGYDATRRIRSLGLTRLPIIALTAGTLTGEQQQAESAGVSDFVGKPFDPQLLVSCIRRHVAVDDRAVAEAAVAAPPVALDRWPVIDGVDAAEARRRLGGDVGLFTSMLERLLDDVRDLGRDLVLDASGMADLAVHLHKLKGSAGTLGAASIQRIAAEAEAACRACDADQTARLLPALADHLNRLRWSAAATLAAAAAAVVADDARDAAALDRAQLVALLQLLRQLDLAALPQFAALSPQLRRLLGNDSYAMLHKQIDDLQFGDAARTLEALGP